MKVFILTCCFFVSFTCVAQKALTTKDYERAEQFLGYNTRSLVENERINAHWINGSSFWYEEEGNGNDRYIIVNAKAGTKKAAVNLEEISNALSKLESQTVSAEKLKLYSLSFSEDLKKASFRLGSKDYNYDIAKKNLSISQQPAAPAPVFSGSGRQSPDGVYTAYVDKYNLWVKNNKTGERTQLTTEGIKNYGYATDNAGWKHSDAAILRWSPDSKKIATFRQDDRNVGDMYLVTTNVGHTRLESWKYPLPGDSIVSKIERIVIDVPTAKIVKLQIPADYHRGTLSDDISSSGTLDDVDFSADGTELAFISTGRDHKTAKVQIANTATGTVRTLFTETVATQYESGQGTINFKYLAATNEIIWYSERDDYGHLYLYDSKTGKLKNQITKGTFVVTGILSIDEKRRQIIFDAVGNDPKNPYFNHIMSASMDGKNTRDLSPETGNHRAEFSPDGTYFINTFSQPDVPNEINVRSISGKMIVAIQKADISKLTATGWKLPASVTLKAADNKTDLYGLLFTPTKMEAGKKYPIIDYIYPGPQGGSVGSWSFSAARGDHQALAELGFVVLVLEGSSNPKRAKSFHDMAYGNMADNTLPDQISGIRQLADKLGYIDTSKVGIWGHSGGGFATAAAMFRYPDFFKVGISESGNHDNRNYEDDWGERYVGLLTNDDAGRRLYEDQANQTYAKNLKGKLMLAHGMMDDNVPPSNTMLVVEALEKANKDFDLVIFPNSRHGYGPYSSYMMRKRWDYFVKNLLGVDHPKEYKFKY